MSKGPPLPWLTDFAARLFVGVLFAMLTVNMWRDFVATGRVTGLLFLLSEALVVVLTTIRRRAYIVDHSARAAMLTTISVIGPPLMRARGEQALVPDLVTGIVSTVGVLIVIAGKLALGRSFGFMPANRGVVARGPYNVVRHPIYAGYLLTHAAALCAYPNVWNVVLVITADVALVLRALAEERVLSADHEYESYCSRVAWHLVPGVF
jgi:protein-S-isoprenylcysteine O-methyltransferase Ste14